MSRATARIPFATPWLPLLLLLLVVCLLSCARSPRVEQTRETWQLSPSAEAGYQYMVYLDAARAGNAKQAEAALSRVLELDQSKELLLELSELKWRMSKPDEAEAVLREGLARYPGDKWLTLRLSDVHRLQRRHAEAAMVLDRYLATEPGDADALLRRAGIALEQERFVEARDILARLPSSSQSTEALYLRAKAEAGLGQNHKAIATLRRALEKDPSYLPGVVELAYLLELENDFAGAERAYARLIELGESSPEIWVKLIDLNLKLNNPEKALTLAQIGPQDKSFLLEAARLLLGQNFYDEAAEVLDPLVRQGKADDELRFFLAVLEYEGRADAEAAMRQLAHVPEDSPYHARSLGFRAQILFAQDKPEQALDVLRAASGLYPDAPDFPELQAWVLSSLGRHGEAERILNQALSKWPDNTQLLYRLGLVFEDQGRSDKALDVMERVIAIDPLMADALNFVGYVLAEQGRDLRRALVLIRKALEIKPDSGYIVDSLAWVLHKLGDNAKAMQEITRAVAMEGSDPSIWEHYGDIARALGKRREARKGYTNALQHGSRHPERLRAKLKGL